MAKRISKTQNQTIVFLLIACVVIWVLVRSLLAVIGAIIPLLICIAIVGGIIWHKQNQKKTRFLYLLNKYRNATIANSIMKRHLWLGQTSQQLLDSRGMPSGVDNKIMATRRREIWKYSPRGAKRYGLRITLDDDIVVGWDQKE